jgi:hypothetical protein
MDPDRDVRGGVVWFLDAAWRWVARLTMIAGLLFLAALWGANSGLRSFLLLVAVLWCVARVMPGLRPARGIVQACAYAVAWVLSAAGWIGLVGAGGALVVALVVVTSPLARFILVTKALPWMAGVSPDATLEALGRVAGDSVQQLSSPPQAGSGGVKPGSAADWWPELPRGAAVRDLDDDDLCLAWRRSYVRLVSSHSVALRLAVVDARRDYLDELARRYPRQLDEWLRSGARAAGDPSAYLRRPQRHRQHDGRAQSELD